MQADPRIVRFMNERVRPMSEKGRAFIAEAQLFLQEYALIRESIPEGVVEDGRAPEGVTPLTGDDIRAIARAMEATVVAATETGAMPVVAKACVRALQVG